LARIHGHNVGDLSEGEEVTLPRAELAELLQGPLVRSLPPGAGAGFNVEEDQAWVKVGKPGTRGRSLPRRGSYATKSDVLGVARSSQWSGRPSGTWDRRFPRHP
jgi:hypothetical protein